MAWILGLIAAVLGGGGVLFYRQRQKQLRADTGKTVAETGNLWAETALLGAQKEGKEADMLVGIIGILRGEIDRLSVRLGALEKRVTALELENRGLRQMVDQFRDLVRRLWTIVIDNGLDADMDLAVAVAEALEDSTP